MNNVSLTTTMDQLTFGEVLLVAIMTLFTGFSVTPHAMSGTERARDTARIADLNTLLVLNMTYQLDQGVFPSAPLGDCPTRYHPEADITYTTPNSPMQGTLIPRYVSDRDFPADPLARNETLCGEAVHSYYYKSLDDEVSTFGAKAISPEHQGFVVAADLEQKEKTNSDAKWVKIISSVDELHEGYLNFEEEDRNETAVYTTSSR